MSDQDPTPRDRDDATPAPQEGTRPGADSAQRPEQQEPTGPLAGLMAASAADASEEAAELRGDTDPEAEALLAQMGVEEEGIAAGQTLGLWLVVIFSILALALVLIYLFIIPTRTQAGRTAEASVRNYEQQDLRAEAAARLRQYSRDGDTYGLPIGRAMAVIAAEYDGAPGDGPTTRQGWNVDVAGWSVDGAVQETPGGVEPTIYRFRADGVEEVGVDREADTVELVEDDAVQIAPEPLDDLE